MYVDTSGPINQYQHDWGRQDHLVFCLTLTCPYLFDRFLLPLLRVTEEFWESTYALVFHFPLAHWPVGFEWGLFLYLLLFHLNSDDLREITMRTQTSRVPCISPPTVAGNDVRWSSGPVRLILAWAVESWQWKRIRTQLFKPSELQKQKPEKSSKASTLQLINDEGQLSTFIVVLFCTWVMLFMIIFPLCNI